MTAYTTTVCDGGENPCAECYVCLTAWAIDIIQEKPVESYGDPGSVRDFLKEADAVWERVLAQAVKERGN